MKYITYRLYIFHGHNDRKTAGNVEARNPTEAAKAFMLQHFENGAITQPVALVAVRESRYEQAEVTLITKWCALTNIHGKRLYITCLSSDLNQTG